ncbi:hypothetical protein DICVIV_04512 [Dictyocaulus viviparus]|uniref:Uncharacterized protein n=1 Tax=Dictyocaulus viviparus TaxID=29172 RepID=A0A0D8XZS0_DICVI|nr:hypothetical protein DICVIV_04512 [Dictyocaulus viviparus]
MNSENDESHCYRKNIVYRSLRKSASQVMLNVRKKLTQADNCIRDRRALRRLNESQSSSPARSQIHVVAPNFPQQKMTACHTSAIDLDGYKFDNESNILQTPDNPRTPPIRLRKTGMTERLRAIGIRNAFKNQTQAINASARWRLAKQKARVKIREIQSPKLPLLRPFSNGLHIQSASTWTISKKCGRVSEISLPQIYRMEERNFFLKRPTSHETEDDILAMQSEWEANILKQNRVSCEVQ